MPECEEMQDGERIGMRSTEKWVIAEEEEEQEAEKEEKGEC